MPAVLLIIAGAGGNQQPRAVPAASLFPPLRGTEAAAERSAGKQTSGPSSSRSPVGPTDTPLLPDPEPCPSPAAPAPAAGPHPAHPALTGRPGSGFGDRGASPQPGPSNRDCGERCSGPRTHPLTRAPAPRSYWLCRARGAGLAASLPLRLARRGGAGAPGHASKPLLRRWWIKKSTYPSAKLRVKKSASPPPSTRSPSMRPNGKTNVFEAVAPLEAYVSTSGGLSLEL